MTRQVGGIRNLANAQGVVLLPSTTVNGAASTNGPSVGGFGWATTMTAELNVVAVYTGPTDTLDVTVQTTIDGTNWLDVVHFTQILGNGSPVIRTAKIANAIAQAEYATTTALGAAAVRNVFGDQWRVKYVVVNGSAAGFQFSVSASFQ